MKNFGESVNEGNTLLVTFPLPISFFFFFFEEINNFFKPSKNTILLSLARKLLWRLNLNFKNSLFCYTWIYKIMDKPSMYITVFYSPGNGFVFVFSIKAVEKIQFKSRLSWCTCVHAPPRRILHMISDFFEFMNPQLTSEPEN